MSVKSKSIIGVLLVLFFISGLIVQKYFHFLSEEQSNILPLRQSSLTENSYKFIDPLLAVRNPSTSPEFLALQNKIVDYIDLEKKSGNISTASVYFRDQNNSGGFSINPTENYSPASLIKVPLMIAYYKIAETNPSILEKKLSYSGEDMNKFETFRSPIGIAPNTQYSVDQLISYMIKYSDNNAAETLIRNLNQTGQFNYQNDLFKDMGIDQVDLTDDYITVRAYSLFFRILYNATYLNREMSEKAMRLLSQADFSGGIESGVPNNYLVSQKFGEFTVKDKGGDVVKRELHNCGVIYYTDHPYLLCIMTKGEDFGQLKNFISNVSRTTFEYVENLYSKK